MVKMGKPLYRDCLDNKEMDAAAPIKQYRKKAKRNRRFNATYIKVPVLYDDRRVILLFSKPGSGSKWKARMYKITPRIVRMEGVNTPPKVPNLFDLAIGFFNHNHMDLDGFYLKCHYL
jgi:hypothetical protein